MTICLCSTGFLSRPVALLYSFVCVVSSVLRASMSRWVDTDDSTARSAPQSVTRAYKYIRSSSSDLCHVRCLAGPASLPGKRKHSPSYFLTLSNSSSFTLILPPSLADYARWILKKMLLPTQNSRKEQRGSTKTIDKYKNTLGYYF